MYHVDMFICRKVTERLIRVTAFFGTESGPIPVFLTSSDKGAADKGVASLSSPYRLGSLTRSFSHFLQVAHSNTLLLEPEIWRVIYPDFVQGFSKNRRQKGLKNQYLSFN